MKPEIALGFSMCTLAAMCLSYPGLVTKGPEPQLVYSVVCRSHFKQQTK